MNNFSLEFQTKKVYSFKKTKIELQDIVYDFINHSLNKNKKCIQN